MVFKSWIFESDWPGRTVAGLAGALVAMAAGAAGTPAAASAGPATAVDIIVRTSGPSESTAAQAVVRRAGGTVGTPLGLISGFAARVPENAVPAVRGARGVAEVTVNGSIRMKTNTWLDDSGWNYSWPGGSNSGSGGPGSSGPGSSGPGGGSGSGFGGSSDGELTGKGVGVALVDSGVASVPGLNQPGKVINGPDLSFDSQQPGTRYRDTFGHGTHMAGIIAGSDPGTAAGAPRFDGVAPGARLISLKVAADDGASDVSQVIAAIDWVVQHRDDAGLNIRVLNLSFGTDSVQDAKLDPLSFAVEAAWRNGIVVVVAVGNDGADVTDVRMPAANPYIIAVGAADGRGTDSRTDDAVADFSTRGDASRHADLVASGQSVVSLRAPGSYVDTNYPGARMADSAGHVRLFRGSGTSQAAAVVSGSVALLLQQRPSLNPDQVKKLLTQTADALPGADSISAGAGELDIAQVLRSATPYSYAQRHPAASGLGSLEQARGTSHVADAATGAMLTGERDIFGSPWTPAQWTRVARDGNAWTGGTWNGNVWTGSAFGDGGSGSKSWIGTTWTAPTWTGRSWAGVTWSGRSWAADAWSSAQWQPAD